MVKDPVCGMEVDPKYSNWETVYQGKTYYFCSEGCIKAFNTHPSKYINRNQGNHKHNQGGMGGCCGGGMGSGWMRYFYIGLLIVYIVSIFLR
jgi:YHS domain-containing protein